MDFAKGNTNFLHIADATEQTAALTPVSIVQDPANGDIYISELGTGRIVKVAAPRQ
jgi:hypothetical protein